MTEVRKIVSRAGDGRRPVVLLDLHDPTSITAARGTFKVTAPAAQDRQSKRSNRFGGARTTGQSHDNGNISGTWRVKGANKNAALDNAEALLAQLEGFAAGAYFQWQPDGASYPTYYELRGPGTWDGSYQWVDWVGTNGVDITLTWPTAPLPEWDECDLWEDFAVNSLADYTPVAGALTDLSIDTANQALTPVVGAALTAERRIKHTARGYNFLDNQGTVQFIPGTTITNFLVGVTLRDTGTSNVVKVYVDDNGTNSRLRIDVNGVNRQSTNLAARLVAGVQGWVRGRIEGIFVYAEYWAMTPSPLDVPTLNPVGYTLTAGEIAALPAGPGGITWVPQQATAVIDEYRAEPWTYRNRTTPEEVLVPGVPGKATARVDAHITTFPPVLPSAWPLFGWTKAPPPYNQIQVGEFDYGLPTSTAGPAWSVAAVSGVIGAATSFGLETTIAKFGRNSLQCVTPATTDTGVHTTVYDRFKFGITYTLSFWARSAAQTTLLRAKLGVSGDVASGTAIALSPAWQLYSVAWTPTNDRDVVTAAAGINAATLTTFDIDGVMLYEGTVAPTFGVGPFGSGGGPPFGVVRGANAEVITGSPSAPTVAADAAALGGFSLQLQPTTAGTAEAWYLVDPNLLPPDDFSDDIRVEVFARIRLDPNVVSPAVVLSAAPEVGSAIGSQRYSEEYGASGKLLTVPATTASYRIYRLGTVQMASSARDPTTWTVRLALSWAASTSAANGFSIVHLYMVPVTRRVAGFTGLAFNSDYPIWARNSAEQHHVIRSDLRVLGASRNLLSPSNAAVGGALLEWPPGNVSTLTAFSTRVPDDPTDDDTTDQAAAPATMHFQVTPRSFMARGS